MTIKIFCDIADISSIKKFKNKSIVKGFTTNPSLMRKAGAKDYKLYSKKILNVCRNKPISFEVFADDQKTIIYTQKIYLKYVIKNQFLLKYLLMNLIP